MNGSVHSVAFNADGSRMFTAGGAVIIVLAVRSTEMHLVFFFLQLPTTGNSCEEALFVITN